MPQVFQVLKCFKCSVFQVHQTKKSNKWQCKLCGEKQSIKRHYGLGTGKECRLHVQKLNSLKGEVDEINEIAKLNESSDDELPMKDKTSVLDKKEANFKSKWSEFVDNTENVTEPEPESMSFKNAEVVLEIPAKRRKFNKPKTTNTSVQITCSSKIYNLCSIPETESRIKNVPLKAVQSTNDVQSNEVIKQSELINSKTKPIRETFELHKTDKNSKWAQFADESDEEQNTDDDDLYPVKQNYGTSTVTNDVPSPNMNKDPEACNKDVKKVDDGMQKNIFSLCNESDIDDVLDF